MSAVSRPLARTVADEARERARERLMRALDAVGLGGYGDATAADLVGRTGIPDTKIYYALEELTDRGLLEAQPGRPRRYRALPAREAAARLEQLLNARVARDRAALADAATLLEPLGSLAREPDAELAYVIKGRESVQRRARALAEGASREFLLLSSDDEFVRSLEPELVSAGRRNVRLKLAVRPKALPAALRRAAEVRAIRCDCSVLVADGRRILTRNVTRDGSEYAVLSADETLVRLGVDYWDSPNCCDSCG
jgi:sugar-specific transcriptional regulator TrmB